MNYERERATTLRALAGANRAPGGGAGREWSMLGNGARLAAIAGPELVEPAVPENFPAIRASSALAAMYVMA